MDPALPLDKSIQLQMEVGSRGSSRRYDSDGENNTYICV